MTRNFSHAYTSCLSTFLLSELQYIQEDIQWCYKHERLGQTRGIPHLGRAQRCHVWLGKIPFQIVSYNNNFNVHCIYDAWIFELKFLENYRVLSIQSSIHTKLLLKFCNYYMYSRILNVLYYQVHLYLQS